MIVLIELGREFQILMADGLKKIGLKSSGE